MVRTRALAGTLIVLAVVGMLCLVTVYASGGFAPDFATDGLDGSGDAFVGRRSDGDSESGGIGGLDGLDELLSGASGSSSTAAMDARIAEGIGDALGDLGDYSSTRVDAELTVAASDVLEEYRAEGVQLVYADYLGVLDDTWACLVQGDRWVEVCIVREDEGDGTSKVETVRIDPDRLAESLPAELFEPGRIEAVEKELDELLDSEGEGDGSQVEEVLP